MLNNLTLKEKISQMFVLGFSGNEPDENIKNTVKEGLGGIIFFAENITSREQTTNTIKNLQNISQIPLFISIDQEGGLVERTINIPDRIDYLTPMALANTNIEDVKLHTEILVDELVSLGFNMDFAPVLDVNTNPDNPVIGTRAFSSDTEEVIKFSKPVIETFASKNIIPVGKHFPGHGEAWIDSHLDMPEINLTMNELEDIHIKPFKKAINNGLDAVMVAHVHYKAFNKEKTPASLSKEVITDYLKNKLNFNGLIISDDMVMGGIANHYNAVESCIKGINGGIDLFIYRDSTPETINIINELVLAVQKGLIPEYRINESVEKILNIKEKYKLSKEVINSSLDVKESQNKIDEIAFNCIKIKKKENLLPLDLSKKIMILSPDKSKVFNLSKDKGKLSEFINNKNVSEITYSINPADEEINSIIKSLQDYEFLVFLSYNAIFNRKQIKLFDSLSKPKIAIATGIPYDTELFSNVDSLIQTFCYKPPILRALSRILTE